MPAVQLIEGGEVTWPLIVIVPTRGRPANVVNLIGTWEATADRAVSRLAFAVDNDDPELSAYFEACDGHAVGLLVDKPGRMVPVLNRAVTVYNHLADNIGFMGDDHAFRTHGWDEHIVRNLRQLGPVGIVYGDDTIQHQALPTAVFMTSSIVRTLGYMVPPGLHHLYADNTWLTWGRRLDKIRYLPDVVIEHVHPIAGKAQWDDTYAAANSGATYEHDAIEFERYCAENLEDDLRKLKELM
jgi:hypothetical protein